MLHVSTSRCFAVAMLMSGLATPVTANSNLDDGGGCYGSENPDTIIDGCTSLIERGPDTDENLAGAYRICGRPT